ncbi:hypothetical protein RF11_00090 [Thelohanellus kitauei]|uniref:Tc1-like transposase DDE domain-containing protein n=1 Tax=Thelohanellus kitauei TaxID=669202 RepID=A0A0C2NHJ1_THEKT|nr:hypothetical protein RF11_00090 [Thelohanellus kitauei]
MPKSYQHVSEDLRRLVIKMVIEERKSQKEVSNTLKIKIPTVYWIVKTYRDKGTVIALTDDMKQRLMETINDDSTICIDGIIEKLHLSVHTFTVWRWLQKINYTWKLTRPIQLKRKDPDTVNPPQRYSNTIYLDECPFNLHTIQSHAWGKKGKTTNPVLSKDIGQNITMILAINCRNIISSEAIVSTGVNSVIFKEFLNKLVTILGREGQYTIVMDNVRFHHSDPDFYDSYPYQIKLLPRYSPFLNPYEEWFSQIKSIVRRDGAVQGTNDLISRMTEECGRVTQESLANYINHCEQFFQPCLNEEDIGRE